MKRCVLLWLYCLLAPLLRAQVLQDVPYQHTPPVVDGDLAEWASQPFSRFSLLAAPGANPAYGNTVQVWLGWDETWLYAAWDIRDQLLVKQERGTHNPRLYLGDAVELYIDPQYDSGERMDLNDYQVILDAGGDYAVFKGDKAAMADSALAPKEVGTATLLLETGVKTRGQLSDAGADEGWTAEMALPWAGLGRKPGDGTRIRLDICLDDLDTLADLRPITGEILSFHFSSWTGSRDFSFPDEWETLVLRGGPGWMESLGARYGKVWLPLLVLICVLALVIILLLIRRIRALRRLPIRSELQSAGWQQVLEATPIMDTASAAPAPSAVSGDPDFVTRIRTLILARLQDDLSPQEIAAAEGVSLRSLQRLFRERLDTTPSQFILVVKMEQAAVLLRRGDRNVNETAWALGFTDPSYFGRVFRKYYGMTPREFMDKS